MARPVRRFSLVCAGLAVVALGNLTCTESLPPFVDPKDLFVGSSTAQYILSLQENTIHISLRVENRYEETLQGVTDAKGTIGISLLSDASIRRTIPFSAANLFTPGKYNPATRVLTVDPDDVLRFDIIWDFRDDKGLYIPDSVFTYYEDPDCPLRCIAEEEVLVIDATVKMFDAVAPTQAESIRLSVCHVNVWIDGISCPPVNTSIPCSKRPADFPVKLPCDSTAQ